MLEFFRSFMKSKLGMFFTLGFVALIAFAFASGDVLNSGGLGSVSSGSKVATAGSRSVTASSLDFFSRRALEQMRQQDPKQTLRTMVASGGLDEVLDGLIDNAAMSEFGKKVGISAGERLVGSELAKSPAFRGTNGNFDDATYRGVIGQQGFTDTVYRQLIADGLVAQQIDRPATFGARVPVEMVRRYAALASEAREGSIALLPAAVFAPKGEPVADALAKFYTANRNNYTLPERRSIRYITFDDSALKNVPAPSDAEVAARYAADKAKYAPSEKRKLTQLVVPTEAAARVVLGDLAKGMSLSDSARAKKLATAEIAPIAQAEYAAQSSAAAASAVFAAAQGKVVGPVKGALGWFIVRVDAIDKNPGKTLDQARSAIATELTAVKKREALVDFSARIESEIDQGGALSDVAKELGATIKQSEMITADGRIYGKGEATLPVELITVLQTAFLMDQEGQPQFAETVPGKTFLVFEVSRIEASAPAPIAEIRAQVIADYQLERGAVDARKAADKVLASAAKGGDMAAAMGALGVALPPVDQVAIKRADLRRYGQAVPPPLALMFAMAKGTAKLLPAPNNRGFYVVALKAITPGVIDPKDPGLPSAVLQMSGLVGREYADQLRKAIRANVGTTKDANAMKALSRQLSGNN